VNHDVSVHCDPKSDKTTTVAVCGLGGCVVFNRIHFDFSISLHLFVDILPQFTSVGGEIRSQNGGASTAVLRTLNMKIHYIECIVILIACVYPTRVMGIIPYRQTKFSNKLEYPPPPHPIPPPESWSQQHPK